jgi:P pilus assembly protein, pilin FimA
MNLNKKILATVLVFGISSFAVNAADQGHGTVTFTGSIIDAPCSINPDSIDQTVNLGQVANVALEDGGTSTPRPFQIKLENCTTATASTVETTFTGAEGANGLLGITGNAKGASIAITDGTGTVVTLGEATNPQAIQDGNNTLSFSAYLKGDGTGVDIIPGDFQSIADFTLAYN